MGESLFTPRTPSFLGLRNFSTSTAYVTPTGSLEPPARIDSATSPSNNKCVFKCGHNHTILMFAGQNAANERFQARVWLWRKMTLIDEERSNAAGLDVPHYFFTMIGTFDVTLGAQTGPAGAGFGATHFLADTVVANGIQSTSLIRDIWSPADDSAAQVLIDTQGANYLEVQFDKDALGSDADTCNAISIRI